MYIYIYLYMYACIYAHTHKHTHVVLTTYAEKDYMKFANKLLFKIFFFYVYILIFLVTLCMFTWREMIEYICFIFLCIDSYFFIYFVYVYMERDDRSICI